MARRKPHRDYHSTLFIFPVFLPLAELLPWLLALIGASAAGLHVVSRFLWEKTRNRKLMLLVALACIGTAGGLYVQRYLTTPSAAEGSTMVEAASHSRLERFSAAPAAPPAPAAGSLTLLWSAQTPHQNIGKPAIAGGLLMVGTYHGTVDAFSTLNGSRVWTLHKHEQVFSMPVVSGSQAFVGEGHHTSPAAALTAFSFPDGAVKWERKFRSHLESYAVLDTAGDRLWIAGGETGLWCLNMHNGKDLWRGAIGHTDIAPLYVNGRLFAAGKTREDRDGSLLYELNPNAGNELHTTALQGNPMGSLLAGIDGEMYMATAIGQVGVTRSNDAGWAYGFTREGDIRWSTRLPAMPLPEGVLLKDKSLLFYTLADGTLIAINTSDGTVAWQQKIGTAFIGDAALIEEPFIKDGGEPIVAAVTSQGMVTLRKARSGEEITHFQIEEADAYPLYHNGILYLVGPFTLRAYAGAGHAS